MFSAMANERMEQLRAILTEQPQNTFARYALAMELMSAGDTDAALAEFLAVLKVDANYVNAYLMGAQALQQAGRTAEALEWLREGIPCAKGAGNRHAESEMQSLLDELEI